MYQKSGGLPPNWDTLEALLIVQSNSHSVTPGFVGKAIKMDFDQLKFFYLCSCRVSFVGCW